MRSLPWFNALSTIAPILVLLNYQNKGFVLSLLENVGKSVLVKKCLGAEAFNNITRLAFWKRFVNSEGVMDEQGQELKAIVANGLNLSASLAMAEHIPWIHWMFPLEEEAFVKNGAHRDKLTRAIMEEHTLACKESGGAGRRVCPSAQLGDIHVRTPSTLFICTPFNGVKAEEIDMSESPGLVTYMKTPLQAVAFPLVQTNCY